uniref:microtubule-severing ATPase n=1 Tax=Macrostomum lignano TaxID=282301 RepID=A0A1I8IEQ7_9PLAT
NKRELLRCVAMATNQHKQSRAQSPISRLKSHHSRAFESLAAALDLDERLQQTEASAEQLHSLISLYRKGVAELEHGLAVRPDSATKADPAKASKLASIQAKMKANLAQAGERLATAEAGLERLRKQPAQSAAKPAPSSAFASRATRKQQPHKPPAAARAAPVSSLAAELKGVDPGLANSILNEVLDRSPGVGFDDVVGNEAAKQALREATVLPSLRPDLFGGLRQPARAVLLFGPPGNGKTLLAKAVATEAGGVFFNISAGSLMSKWVGEAEKLVRALFALARQLAPAVIFIDEVDSILSVRGDKETEVSRRLKTQFLVELDGVRAADDDSSDAGGKRKGSGGIFLLAATNRPAEIDPAVVRRFGRRLYIGMPDSRCRLNLLSCLLAKHDSVDVSEAELRELAELTDGYSASDLANLAREAAMEPLRQIRPDRLATVAKAAVRPLRGEDLRNCLARVRPSVPPESLAELLDWSEKYGSDGGAS